MTTRAARRPSKGRTIKSPPRSETVGQLLNRLGVPARRVLLTPPPGTATEEDLIDVLDHQDRLVELVEGTLVEKAMGFLEGRLGTILTTDLHTHARNSRTGICVGDGSPMRILLGTVRLPDVSFVSFERLPNRRVPTEPIGPFAPDFAIEILSQSNTRREMARKRREYFEGGCRLVWEIDPRKQTVRSYTSPDDYEEFGIDDTIDAGPVLKGFTVSLKKLFDDALNPPGLE